MTNEDKRERREKREREFIGSLLDYAGNEDRAALANLRRGLGKKFGTAPEVFPFVTRFAAIYEEEDFALIGSLFALHPEKNWRGEDKEKHKRNFGASLLWFAGESNAEASTERRFVALLNCDREDLQTHLRQAVSLLKSKEIPVDWLQLLQDVRHWNNESRFVQKKWARGFWRGADDENLNLNKNSENQNPEEEN